MKFSENCTHILAAIVKFQSLVKNPPKNKEAKIPTKNGNVYFYKYADLADIADVIREPMAKCGLAWFQNPVLENKQIVGIYTIIVHESGEMIEFDPVPVKEDERNQTNTASQKQGAAITYARRHSLSLALGLAADEDDDANAISEMPTKTQRQTQKQAKPQQRDQARQTKTVAQAQQNKAELINGMKEAVENIKDHAPTREEIQADLEKRKAKGRQEVHKMACVKKGLTKEESRAIIKAETGKGELKELTLDELTRMYKFFNEISAEELKETAKAHLIDQQEKEILNKEIDEILNDMNQTGAA